MKTAYNHIIIGVEERQNDNQVIAFQITEQLKNVVKIGIEAAKMIDDSTKTIAIRPPCNVMIGEIKPKYQYITDFLYKRGYAFANDQPSTAASFRIATIGEEDFFHVFEADYINWSYGYLYLFPHKLRGNEVGITATAYVEKILDNKYLCRRIYSMPFDIGMMTFPGYIQKNIPYPWLIKEMAVDINSETPYIIRLWS